MNESNRNNQFDRAHREHLFRKDLGSRFALYGDLIEVRERYISLALGLIDIPDSREKSLVLTKLQETYFWEIHARLSDEKE